MAVLAWVASSFASTTFVSIARILSVDLRHGTQSSGMLTQQYQGGHNYTVQLLNTVMNYGGYLVQAVKGAPGKSNQNVVGTFTQYPSDGWASQKSCSAPKTSYATHTSVRYELNQRNNGLSFNVW